MKHIEKMDKEKLHKSFRNLVVDIAGGCKIQQGKDGMTYPCGTCFCSGLSQLGLDEKHTDYKEHNEPVDRINEVWRAVLQIRDTKV